MLISLFAAFVFTPWFAMYIKPSLKQIKVAEEKEHKARERIDRFFRSVLPPLIHNRLLGWSFLIGLVMVFFAVCAMFYTTAVVVKMLPYDNKAEFSVVVDMREGTAVSDTENLNRHLAEILRDIPEVSALQTYAGTAKPFDFNGMVRHYYLRTEPWHGELQVQLTHKSDRKRSSHEIAKEAREKLTPVAREAGARITIAEMPPGPPVIQAVAAEIYGPDRKTRVEVAEEMTRIFESVENLADVDNYIPAPHDVWRFEVDTQKSVRRGISVDAIIRNLSMAMGGFKVDRLKVGSSIEPTYIVIEVPLSVRTQMSRLTELPIASPSGAMVPLGELGRFVQIPQDPIIYHQDLRPVEYVIGDAVGRLGAPIYPMLEVDRILQDYTTPDGQVMSGHMIGPPPADGRSGFEWGGEWTVTYETFRDMGISFAVALVLIYMLVVGMFGNFSVPAVIMAPIPLTLLGIIPGHWIMNAQFTATSMIGFIALAGIIVRNSILLVDFAIAEVKRGISLEEAVIRSCEARTRPIMITAFALVGGSSVILTDPIFQGMAVSLLFGVLVSTLLTLVVIPLGCVSIGIEKMCPSVAKDKGEEAHAT